MVRINFWSLPLSATALRAALILLVNVDSETIRPPDVGDQIILTDDAIAVLHEIDQQVEHLRFEGNLIFASA